MNAEGRFDPEQLLADARGGRSESLGRVLELNRTFLALLARTHIDVHLQGRIDASDLVQETFLDACRDFDHFRGSSVGEWAAWLRSSEFHIGSYSGLPCRAHGGGPGYELRAIRGE